MVSQTEETRRQAARRGVDEEACMHKYEETEIQYGVSKRTGVNEPRPGAEQPYSHSVIITDNGPS